MSYGYFDDDKKEYVITRPDTPLSWSNYLDSTEYGVPEFRRERNRVMQHSPYSVERQFYALVADGNVAALEEAPPVLLKEGQGILSADPLVNMRGHFVVSTALATRACIEAGLPSEGAYTVSDGFIQRMNELDDADAIERLHTEMVFSFAGKMREMQRQPASSRHVRRAIDYINLHLDTNLYIEEIAAFAGVNEKYLSSLFKKETDIVISDYIERRKMETARNMLLYTDFSCAEIADTLCYASQSYFSKLFRKHYGAPPAAFRTANSP